MSSITVEGILSFPTLFKPRAINNSGDPKYSLNLLFRGDDSELARLYQLFGQVKTESYPSGTVPSSHKMCLDTYANKMDPNKPYYDQRLADEGWWTLSCTAPAERPPKIVDLGLNDVIDPGHAGARAGMRVKVNLGMGYFNKGGGQGIGAWMNGVQLTEVLGELGQLSNEQSAEDMFGAPAGHPAAPGGTPPVPGSTPAAPPAAPAGPGPTAPTTAAPPAPPAPTTAAPAGPRMTAAANGISYEAYRGQGWTDEQLIANGLMEAV